MKGSREIAAQRIETLFRISQDMVKSDSDLARRYIHLLLRIAQRTRTKIPRYIKRGICHKCRTPLISGYNSRTRIRQTRESHIVTTCHSCGAIYRIPLREKEIDITN